MKSDPERRTPRTVPRPRERRWHVALRLVVTRTLLLVVSEAVLLVAGPIIQPATSQAAAQSTGRATVYRDPWGIPHAYADREEDGFFGLGYAQAEDRLTTILALYLRAKGEQAAAFGPTFLESDFDQLLLRHLVESRAGMPRMPPQLSRDYAAFVAGIGRYMADHPAKVPVWAPALEPALPMAAFRSFLWSRLLFDGVVHWERPGPRDGKCSRPARPGAPLPADALEGIGQSGSNEWVLMPWRTADGAVIHLGDPHGGFGGSWEFRLDAGPIKAAASSFPGTALPFIGHTRHLAWAFTLFGTDGMDCYAVVTDPRDPRRYQFDGAWQRMVTERVTVRVKGATSVTRTLEYTRHNGVLSPVVRRAGDTAFVLSIPDMHQAGLYDEQFYRVALARSMAEFKTAIAPGFISANVMAGSADGHSFYVRGGYVPRRPPGVDYTQPMPGNSSATAWRGIHSLEEHVTLEDPAVGYMSNNNIAPDRMLERGSPDLARYRGYLYDDQPGRTTSRGVRAIEVLSRAYRVTVADAVELALDDKWVGVERWQEALRMAAETHPARIRGASPDVRRFLDRLLRFDGHARQESQGALAFYYWWVAVRSDTARFRTLRPEIERGGTPAPGTMTALLVGLDSAVALMVRRHGTVETRMGDEFRAGRGGVSFPVGNAPLPGLEFLDGVAVLKALSFTPIDSAHRRWANGGGYHTTLTIFTDPIQSFSLSPLGQSPDPASPHHSDLARLMSERKLKPTLFAREAILREQKSARVLEFTLPPHH
ncbi:MAG: penicillin acylase family protein [Gemmatimonadales bacterium]